MTLFVKACYVYVIKRLQELITVSTLLKTIYITYI